MAQMTEEEAWALEEAIFRNPPDVAGKPGGSFTERRDRMVILDNLSAAYIKAAADSVRFKRVCRYNLGAPMIH